MTGLADEASVEARSAHLPKDLGLVDLTLTQVLFIVGLPWVGVAAKQGPAHVVLWLAAIVFFYLPSAAVVIHLNRAMPLEVACISGRSSDSASSPASWSRGTSGSLRS